MTGTSASGNPPENLLDRAVRLLRVSPLPILVALIAVLGLLVLRSIWEPMAGVSPEVLDLLLAMVILLVILVCYCYNRLVSYVKSAIQYDSKKDLKAEMVDLRAALLLQKAQHPGYNQEVAQVCDTLLLRASEKCKEGEVNAGWRYYVQAKVQRLCLLEDKDPLVWNHALQTLSRSTERLSPPRLASIKKLLEEPQRPGEPKKNVTVNELFSANCILEEYVNDRFDSLDRAAWQLYILSAVALMCLIALAVTIPALSSSEPSGLHNDRLLVPVIVIVGALGGATGGFFSVFRLFKTKNAITYEQTMSSWMIAIRPLIGAVFALVASFLLLSGLLSMGSVTLELLLSISFVAGFSEHFVIDIVTRISKEAPAKEL